MTNILVTATADVSLTGGTGPTSGTIQIEVVPSGDSQTAYVTNGNQTTQFTLSPSQILNATSQVLVNVPSGSYDIYASVLVNASGGGGTAGVNGTVNALSVRTNI